MNSLTQFSINLSNWTEFWFFPSISIYQLHYLRLNQFLKPFYLVSFLFVSGTDLLFHKSTYCPTKAKQNPAYLYASKKELALFKFNADIPTYPWIPSLSTSNVSLVIFLLWSHSFSLSVGLFSITLKKNSSSTQQPLFFISYHPFHLSCLVKLEKVAYNSLNSLCFPFFSFD